MSKLSAELTLKILIEIQRGVNEGGSSDGMHMWADAAKCGMRAWLAKQHKREEQGKVMIPPLTTDAMNIKSAFAVGSAYHKLHELWRTGMIRDSDLPLQFPAGPMNASVEEAARLFNGWAAHWPRDFWGKTLAIEGLLPTPGDTEAAAQIVKALGAPVTARPDMVVEIRPEDLPRVHGRCPAVVEPGIYIIDLKTSDQPYSELYYKGGLQALWYPAAWNIQFPDSPCKGIIFDCIFKFGRRKNKEVTIENFDAIYVPTERDIDVRSLRGMIGQGHANIQVAKDYGVGNRSECMQFSFGGINVCRWYGNGCTNEGA